MDKQNALHTLHIETLYPWQDTLLTQMLGQRDIACFSPTSSGKSAVFQSFALMSEGLVVVNEPHLALELDQSRHMNDVGVPAAYINSLLTTKEKQAILNRIHKNELRLLYLTPEMLQNKKVMKTLYEAKISAFIVDEAHCVVKQGTGFREEYLKLGEFIDHLPNRPVVGAFTATATEWTTNEIIRLLHMDRPFIYRASITRDNITLSAIEIGNGLGGKKDSAVIEQRKRETIIKTLKKAKGEQVIIYSNTRSNVEALCKYLNGEGYSSDFYHSKCTDKGERLRKFTNRETKIMVATSAFGLGVNIPHIRLVIHHAPLFGLDDYLQEAGRAGRDGKPAKAILLWHEYDFSINKRLLEKPKDALTGRELKERLSALDALHTYAKDKSSCRWRLIRIFFDEEKEKRCKHNCDNCKRK